MGVYAAVISSIISTGIKLFASSQSPDYPSAPKMRKINIQQTRDQMENYEKRRMDASLRAWKEKFPLLDQGGQYEIADIGRNQQGYLSPQVSGALKSTGLGTVKEGDQYKQAVDLGLNPITLAQRNSQAVNRQIAMNPEWSSKISGGTLATMIANNYQNQNAYAQFLGATNTAKATANAAAGSYNTASLLTGIVGAAGSFAQSYTNRHDPQSPLNPQNPAYSDVTTPGYYTAPAPAQQVYPYGNTWMGMYTPNMMGAVSTPPPSTGGGVQSPTTNYNTYF